MPVEPPSTLPALFAAVVARRGSHPAIVTMQETLSYDALDARSARFARALLAAGAGKGARIALLAPDGVFWVTAFLGALRIGALLTTISTLCAPPELAHILENSDCQILVVERRMLTRDFAATLEQALPGLAEQPAGRIMLPSAPFLREIWLDDCNDVAWAQPIAALEALADSPQAPDAAVLAAAEAEVSPADEAIVVYTSGSTAEPKAVVHRQWAAARHSPVLATHFALTEDDRMMGLLPAFWLAGMSMMLQVLSIGATLVYPSSPAIEDALEALARLGVTRVNAWGDKQPQLIRAAREAGIAIDHVPDLARFRDPDGRELPDTIPMYGMTESFSAHSAFPLGQALPPGKEAAFGRAINGYERRVVSTVSGAVLPPGEVGELQIRGPAMLAGFYRRDPRDVFTKDGFYPTRDLVRIDADGWLFPEGRIDDMIKTRGANVSRLEVEAALLELPEVAAAVVAGIADAELGKMVVAAVVPAPGTAFDEAALRAALRARLSSFKVPRRIVAIAAEDIPRTATGKVRIAALAGLLSSIER